MKRQGVKPIEKGDVVLFHTGWTKLIGKDNKRYGSVEPGLGVDGAKYLASLGVAMVGADTWGVDYVLLTRRDEMLGQPYAYRDARTNGMMEKAFRKVPRSDIFAQTGLQFMQFNTLYQLYALKLAGSPARRT